MIRVEAVITDNGENFYVYEEDCGRLKNGNTVLYRFRNYLCGSTVYGLGRIRDTKTSSTICSNGFGLFLEANIVNLTNTEAKEMFHAKFGGL
tara:strand:- start:127 stop:402 length:276 start_codon:yes stop_codon:yes gene_type:complete